MVDLRKPPQAPVQPIDFSPAVVTVPASFFRKRTTKT